MKAVALGSNRDFILTEVPDPSPKCDEVLIDIKAAGVNRADLLQREGSYPPPPGWPEWMGLEVAGQVEEAPTESRWKKGDKVCALLGSGGYAEKVAVPAGMVLPVPDGLSMAEAAAIPEVFATSYLNICIEGAMKAGDTVFIQAGASGVGTAAVQLVKALGGKIVTAVGSREKAEFVRKLGADVVINRKTENIAEILGMHPPDIALDCVAGPHLGDCLKAMARGGRWVVIATLGGTVSELDMGDFFRRGIKLTGSTLRSRSPEMKGKILAGLEKQLWDDFSKKTVRPVIHKIMPMTMAEEAHGILQRSENIGKVILTNDEKVATGSQ